jgi:hypothetical protein
MCRNGLKFMDKPMTSEKIFSDLSDVEDFVAELIFFGGALYFTRTFIEVFYILAFCFTVYWTLYGKYVYTGKIF